MEEVDEYARRYINVRRPDHVVISCQMKLNYPYLLEKIWEKLDLVRVYTKKKGFMPDFEDPLVLTNDRNGVSVKSICL
jgi:ribosome-interacting GTPase 1